ncbi:MMPL family transporter [Mycobacteroides stephanolepidis]|nr:MMPL family transporter [[Mycobacterium] stephanolepidis]
MQHGVGSGSGLLGRVAALVGRSPKMIVGLAALFTIAAGLYGLPASQSLPAGGYDVPNSESLRAQQFLQDEFGVGGNPIYFTVTAQNGADSTAALTQAHKVVSALSGSQYIHQITWYGQTPAGVTNPLISKDGRTGLVVARLEGDDTDAPARARHIADPLVGAHDGVSVQGGGQALTYDAGNRQSREDLIVMEVIAFPITFLALVWIFGSAVAALLPLVVSLFAIAGTAAALSALNLATDVSIFGVNVATALGLALAIDYTLFIVSRYREELVSGSTQACALNVTMQTAGRTVLYSAMTMACTVAVMLIFPQYLLKSLAYASLISVILSLVGALVVAPALIVLLGDKLNKFDIRSYVGHLFRRSDAAPQETSDRVWARIARFSTNRPVTVIIVIGAVLALLGFPVLGIKLAYPDDRVLPTSQTARLAGDIVRTDFDQNFTATTRIGIMGESIPLDSVDQYAQRLSEIGGVRAVSAPGTVYIHGQRVGPSTPGSADLRDTGAYVSLSTDVDPFSDQGKNMLETIKGVPGPAQVLVDSLAQKNKDNIAGITDRLPLVLIAIIAVTFVLIFLMTGSIILPIKALVMNLLSLCVAFGALVWIFQDGNLGGLGTVATGHFTAFIPPLLACIAYALAIDYEIFVLSRIREAWLATDGTPAGNKQAVAVGLMRTGRIVTAAATVMIVVFIAISAGQVAFMRGLGVGLAVGVAVDAFLVRPLLVPAFMQLMGRLNWWAPGPLARWHRRWGLVEESEPSPVPVTAGTR